MQLMSPLLLLLLLWLQLLLIAAQMEPGVRQKRGTLTLDFGLLLRNVLQKSAQLSGAKANITRNIAAAATQTTRRPAATTAAPTTAAPPPAARPRRPRPQYGPGWWPPHAYGYYPYDYDTDYGYAPQQSPPAPPPPPLPLPRAVPRRVRPPPRPLSNYYDYDYDVDEAAPPAPPPPRPVARSRARAQPQPPAEVAPPPPPPAPAPAPPPPRPRPRPAAVTQLNDQLIYQYAQPDDIYSKPDTYAAAPTTAAAAAAAVDEVEEVGADADADVAGDVTSIDDNPSSINIDNDLNAANDANEQSNVANPQRFLVNYPGEDADAVDAAAQYAPEAAANFNAYAGATGPEFKYYNNYASAAPGTQQSNYYVA